MNPAVRRVRKAVQSATSVSPRRAVRYATGSRRSSSDRTAAIVWLALLVLGLKILRDQALPDVAQTPVLVGGGALVVLAGTVAPDLVFWSLVALFVAAVLIDVPYLTPAIDAATARVGSLTRFAGS